MTPLDRQLDWIVRQIRDFVLSHYSCRISLDCKQGVILQIENEPTALLSTPKNAEIDLKNFCMTANVGDTITFTYRRDEKFGRKAKTVLRVPVDG